MMPDLNNMIGWREEFRKILNSDEYKSTPSSFKSPFPKIKLSMIIDYILIGLENRDIVIASSDINKWIDSNPGIMPLDDPEGYPHNAQSILSDFQNWYRFKYKMDFNPLALMAAENVRSRILRGEVIDPPHATCVEALRKEAQTSIDFDK